MRLTAPDGYTAQRSYSIASPPSIGDEIELTVERLAGGEVSTFLHEELVVGDALEVRGPSAGGSCGMARPLPSSSAAVSGSSR